MGWSGLGLALAPWPQRTASPAGTAAGDVEDTGGELGGTGPRGMPGSGAAGVSLEGWTPG